jgi:hypothetical protein
MCRGNQGSTGDVGQTGLLRYFEIERDALEFLAEIDDTVLH